MHVSLRLAAIVSFTLAMECSTTFVHATPAPGAPQTLMFGEHRIEWRGAEQRNSTTDELAVVLKTNRGQINARYHPAASTTRGVIWLSGAGGGVDGPARRLYVEGSKRLQQQGIASLRLDYRNPQDLSGSVLDALCGVAFLAREGISRVVIVGHSFGGAVAICAGASSPRVRGVVALSSQTAGALQMAPHLAPRSLLIVHGTRDKVLPPSNARAIYGASRDPRQLRLLEDAGHGLTLQRETLLDLLLSWIPAHIDRAAR